MEYDFLVYICALNRIFSYRSAVGIKLVDEFEDVSEIFRLSRSQLNELFGVGSRITDSILNPATLEWAREEVDWALSSGIDLVPFTDSRYPGRLKECEDAPIMLYCRGTADLNPERSLAVVGTRRATFYGRDWCRRIVEMLSDCGIKPMIVSGLALGIDGVAHITAIDNKMPTVAVLPSGLDDIYPPKHRDLAERIAECGMLITDFCSRSHPARSHFVRRNRIIAGMADAVLLCESYMPGGGLITARLAASYSRDVFALPGRVTDYSFAGCNKMISDQIASIVTDERTVAHRMGWNDISIAPSEPLLFPDTENSLKQTVLKEISVRQPMHIDELVSVTSVSFRNLSVVLLELETEGRISLECGKYVLRH